jgi:hypothetical protein
MSMSDPGRSDYIRDLGTEWLAEVAELRRVEVPEIGDGPEKFSAALLKARASLDRVEEILSQATALSSAAKIRARELTDRADDKLDTVLMVRSKRAREYESARERLADAKLDPSVFPLIREARAAQKVADMAANIEARVRLAHRGLDGLRQDLAAALRHVSWESNLDR